MHNVFMHFRHSNCTYCSLPTSNSNGQQVWTVPYWIKRLCTGFPQGISTATVLSVCPISLLHNKLVAMLCFACKAFWILALHIVVTLLFYQTILPIWCSVISFCRVSLVSPPWVWSFFFFEVVALVTSSCALFLLSCEEVGSFDSFVMAPALAFSRCMQNWCGSVV